MTGHSRVDTWEDISTSEFVIYRLHRTGEMPPVVVWLSDAYQFTDAEFYAGPTHPSVDAVLIARPEAIGNEPLWWAKDGIGIGNIAGLMGALNREHVDEYGRPS